ncbi:hypothetical protein SAVIM338S_05170 [Streptomyces avidinii]
MRYVEAPAEYRPAPGDAPSVFLAGGITHCPRWQPEAAAELARFVVLNPRRADVVTQLAPSRPGLQVRGTLPETLTAARTLLTHLT